MNQKLKSIASVIAKAIVSMAVGYGASMVAGSLIIFMAAMSTGCTFSYTSDDSKNQKEEATEEIKSFKIKEYGTIRRWEDKEKNIVCYMVIYGISCVPMKEEQK